MKRLSKSISANGPSCVYLGMPEFSLAKILVIRGSIEQCLMFKKNLRMVGICLQCVRRHYATFCQFC